MQHLIKTPWVCEEDLIILGYSSPYVRKLQISSSTPISIISTAITTTTANAAMDYQPGKRKGSVCTNKCGKHFGKQSKIFQPGGNEYLNNNSNKTTDLCLREQVTNSTNEVFFLYSIENQTDQQVLEAINNFGYVTIILTNQT